ncbi:MAG TPA: hypothetical protein VF121_04490 [Thermoanaerobaculia bacterium]|nr:hypothetical protein [Thermoanaerobaculia bacterium]
MAIVLTAAVAAASAGPTPAHAQPTVLDFEDLPDSTTVTTQYGDRGVLLFSAFLDEDLAARSPNRVLRVDNPIHEFAPGPFVIEFTSGQARVRLFAGISGDIVASDPVDGTLRAYDGSGGLIAQDGPKPVAISSFTTLFEVATATPSIRRLELEIGTTAFEAIDDFEFEGEAPPPPPTAAPVVEITTPADGAELDGSPITVAGTVTGEALFPTAVLTMEVGRPPDSTAPPLTAAMSLTGSGSTRGFTLEIGLGVGPHVITVEAENTAHLEGADTVRLTNLPQAIRQRFASDGGAATFGTLRYGGTAAGCVMAVYDLGAIAAVGTQTFVVRGGIFDKWFTLRDPGAALARLGCPTGEERAALGGARAQDFTGGRIYAGLPTGAHFVPAVFVNAIDQLGGEEGTGVPIMDPTDSIGVMETWLFQRFDRPDQPHLLPSTLEIRGSPPVLSVERQGGDLKDLFLEDSNEIAFPRVPTLWLQFPCEGLLGPCPVTPPSSGPPIEDAGDRFCDGTTYPWGPPEWQAIEGDHVLTPLLGIVRSSHKAGQDNPLTHEHFSGPEDLFASDWNVGVRPLHPFRNLVAENTYVEVEFEVYFANPFFVQFDEPFKNDLYFAGGRLIIDCGHTPYRSEIHPPFVTAHMRTGTLFGRPATEATIWVNGFYTGDPVAFDIFPPPRPSPDSFLTITKPIDEHAEFNVDSTFSFQQDHVRVAFSASPRRVEVTGAGEMKWESRRAYTGRWYVGWSPE